MLTYSDLKDEFRLNYDSYDAWGSVMGVFFDMASELYMRDAAIPVSWGYSPGLGDDPREKESYFYDVCLEVSTEDLLTFGKVLERFANILKTQGKDY